MARRFEAKLVTGVCCQCENNRKPVGRQVCVDLGWHMRVVGCTGEVRFLCKHHARGLGCAKAFRQAVPLIDAEAIASDARTGAR